VLGACPRFAGRKPPRGTEERTASGGVAYEAGDGQASIDIDVVVGRYGFPIPSMAEELRGRVGDEVQRLTGLEVVEVNLDVQDLHVAPPGID